MEEIVDRNCLEQILVENLALIEIAEKYCDTESDKSGAISALSVLMKIIINKQYEAIRMIDCVNT